MKKIPSIPLRNLNCTHCILSLTECKNEKRYNTLTKRFLKPEEFYCFKIGRNYSEEIVK